MRTVCPTRRTTVSGVGTGLPNHCLHQAYWFYFLNHSISSLLCCVLVHICLKTLTKDFLNFLSSISSVCLSSSCLSSVYAFCTLCLFSFHHDDCAYVMLCLHLSTYSATSSPSLRNFLTLKFLSEEFIKISYSPPSSRYNALSVIALVMMRSFMYESSRLVVMFTFMLGQCIIMLEPFICLGFHSLLSSGICHWLFLPFWIFLIMVAMYWEKRKIG